MQPTTSVMDHAFALVASVFGPDDRPQEIKLTMAPKPKITILTQKGNRLEVTTSPSVN